MTGTRIWHPHRPTRRRAGFAAALAVLGTAGFAACSGDSGERSRSIVVGRPPTIASTTTSSSTSTTAPTTSSSSSTTPSTTAPPSTAAPVPVPLYGPDGAPYGPALSFVSAVPVPDRLVFVMVVGSDARPGHDPLRANADSIHLLAVDPRTGRGTILGFPRDSWVSVPGKGAQKLTAALALGGPNLLAETVRQVTGLPVDYYVVTGFAGFKAMVEEVGGVNVEVGRRMRDLPSGAFFDAGWHHMSGDEALAFARNRKDVPNGDFSRSENQGRLILAALAKLRAEVGNASMLANWIEVLSRHATLDLPLDKLVELANMARSLDPASLRNIVLPGRVGTVGRQSVVFLSPETTGIFEDIRADAVIGS